MLNAALTKAQLPRHVAIIMDGNGRWARKRHLPREAGHVAGVAAVREVVRAAVDLGLKISPSMPFLPRTGSGPRPKSAP